MLTALFLLIWLIWDTPVIYPLKLLVVFFHESSHALVAILTGGAVDHIEVGEFEGGVCYTRGGIRFLVLSAGYLGSIVWGGVLLFLANQTRFDRFISMVLGFITALVGWCFVRPIFGFGQLFVVLTGVALCTFGVFLPPHLNNAVMTVIGLTSCMYATLDIKSDILDTPFGMSDASMLAQVTGISPFTWGLIWVSIAIACSTYFLMLASRHRFYTWPAGQLVQYELY